MNATQELRPRDLPRRLPGDVRLEAKVVDDQIIPAWWPRNEAMPVWVGGVLPTSVVILVLFDGRRRSTANKSAWQIARQLKQLGYTCKVCAAGDMPKLHFRDRRDRLLPLDNAGTPMCPGCGEYDCVTIRRGQGWCSRCLGDLRHIKPLKHLPDF